MGASFVHSAVGWVEARAMCFRTDPEHCADTHQRQNNAIAALNAILRGGCRREHAGTAWFFIFFSIFSGRIPARPPAIWP